MPFFLMRRRPAAHPSSFLAVVPYLCAGLAPAQSQDPASPGPSPVSFAMRPEPSSAAAAPLAALSAARPAATPTPEKSAFQLGDISYDGGFQTDPESRLVSSSGVIPWPNGDRHSGSVKLGKRDGRGRFQWSDGLVAEGVRRGDRLDDNALLVFPDGNRYSGSVSNALPNGKGHRHCASGHRYAGDFKAGLMQGTGVSTAVSGDHHDGGWAAGQDNGYGSYVWAAGHAASGTRKNGVLIPEANQVTGSAR